MFVVFEHEDNNSYPVKLFETFKQVKKFIDENKKSWSWYSYTELELEKEIIKEVVEKG